MPKLGALIPAIVLGLAVTVQADTLDMQGTDDAARFEGSGKPTRGMTQARVQAAFGAPQARRGAVGDPPISSWEYGDFVVYFEYDKVIHAVTRRGASTR